MSESNNFDELVEMCRDGALSFEDFCEKVKLLTHSHANLNGLRSALIAAMSPSATAAIRAMSDLGIQPAPNITQAERVRVFVK